MIPNIVQHDLELEALRLTWKENLRRRALGMTPEQYVFIGDVYDTLDWNRYKSLCEAKKKQASEKVI